MLEANDEAPLRVEDIYQKKSQLEHILLRPDTYIGSVEHQQQTLWVHDGTQMTQRSISFVPGLYKIFDEIIVNAADNKVRDPTMDCIKVCVDQEQGKIRVWNNGAGIPVQIHEHEGVYVPELIFGHLLTSSNYRDDEKKVTGGRNGYGAKLSNIFSKDFVIETCDGLRQKKYKQRFSMNMSKIHPPKITACKASDNWTCVEFQPDFQKFGMEVLEDDVLALMRKRAYDLAGILAGVKVYFNGSRIPVKNFQDYVKLYLGPKSEGRKRVHEKAGPRWEVVVSPTDGQHQQAERAISKTLDPPSTVQRNSSITGIHSLDACETYKKGKAVISYRLPYNRISPTFFHSTILRPFPDWACKEYVEACTEMYSCTR